MPRRNDQIRMGACRLRPDTVGVKDCRGSCFPKDVRSIATSAEVVSQAVSKGGYAPVKGHDLLPESSGGLEVVQLFEEPGIPSCHVYMEAHTCTPDPRFVIFRGSGTPHGAAGRPVRSNRSRHTAVSDNMSKIRYQWHLGWNRDRVSLVPVPVNDYEQQSVLLMARSSRPTPEALFASPPAPATTGFFPPRTGKGFFRSLFLFRLLPQPGWSWRCRELG